MSEGETTELPWMRDPLDAIIGEHFDFVKSKPKREELDWPFNQVDYDAECPEGHMIELSTGYSVGARTGAPWQQLGWCGYCRSDYIRTITQTGDGRFEVGPLTLRKAFYIS